MIPTLISRKAKDVELKEKIKEHTESMKSRRKKPKGNPQEEMEAALKELEIVSFNAIFTMPV